MPSMNESAFSSACSDDANMGTDMADVGRWGVPIRCTPPPGTNLAGRDALNRGNGARDERCGPERCGGKLE